MRFLALTVASLGCAAAFGAGFDDSRADGAGKAPWRVYKVSPLTWSVTRNIETNFEDFNCHTPASLTARSDPFYVGTPATARVSGYTEKSVRFGKAANKLAYGRPFVVPARMTLIVGQTTCDNNGQAGSCAGTYHSRGGVIGYVHWGVSQNRNVPSQMSWSHKIASADHRPPMSCGQAIGEPVYGLFFGGAYHPVAGGHAFSDAKYVPLLRKSLVAGRRFTTSRTNTDPVTGAVEGRSRATFKPVRRGG